MSFPLLCALLAQYVRTASGHIPCASFSPRVGGSILYMFTDITIPCHWFFRWYWYGKWWLQQHEQCIVHAAVPRHWCAMLCLCAKDPLMLTVSRLQPPLSS